MCVCVYIYKDVLTIVVLFENIQSYLYNRISLKHVIIISVNYSK